MISHPRSGGPSRNDEPDKPGAYEPADNPPVVQTASSVSKDPPTQPLLAQAPDPSTLEVFVELTNGLRATPLHVPQRLLEAFRALKVDPVLSGGAALQIWTGRFDDIFMTPDLDMVSHLQVRELIEHGINIEKSGRHAIVDGVAVEFPSGDLAVNDLYLDRKADTVLVPTLTGDRIRCIRPEACVLDRLTQVVVGKVRAAFLQAAAVVVAQSGTPGWDADWIERSAVKAGLSRIWTHLKADLENPSEDGIDRAVEIGTDRETWK